MAQGKARIHKPERTGGDMKQLNPTKQDKEKLRKQAIKKLNEAIKNGHNSITINLETEEPDDDEKPIVLMTAKAYVAIWALVNSMTTEVAWHGTVTKHKPNIYLIKEVFTYPQIVSGATVESDDDAYPGWFSKIFIEQPEKADMIRYQGHSHVSMGTTPSTTDDDHRERILRDISDDGFYIFSIQNKRGDSHFHIYDKAKNRLYENKDITIDVIMNDGKLRSQWFEEQKAMITTPKVPEYPVVYSYQGNWNYGNKNYRGGRA
jgi:hypothetical protein